MKGIQTPEIVVWKLQRTLSAQARKNKKWRAWSLYGDLCRADVLSLAFDRVAANGGSGGVDGMTVAWAKANREEFLGELENELRTKAYRASAVRRVYIPKAGGKKRALGIPTVKDRTVQTALVLLLEPIFEVDFHDRSFGYRPGRSAHGAIEQIKYALYDGLEEAVDADLSSYFDTIPHDRLIEHVKRRVSDGSILKLIKMWLEAPVEETDDQGRRRRSRPGSGTPQGGVISPLLANLYLNGLDHQVNGPRGEGARMVRYADDLVILCRRGRGEQMRERLKRYLETKGLTLNEEKTRLVDVRQEWLEFLGFSINCRRSWRTGRDYIHVEPSRKSQTKLRETIRDEVNRFTTWRDAREVVCDLNRRLRGWGNYFRLGQHQATFAKLQRYAEHRLIRWLAAKHDCRSGMWKRFTWRGLHEEYGLYDLLEREIGEQSRA
ncbi:MAG: group II intron reverse transcriptase/maturase [Verrucomicrobia bacterium]|nr:group II intron reverse transcriptase/maturase [Verrucomicrobiota bacterium]